MPRKPKKPCAYTGCPNLTEKKYCPEHERLESQRYDRYQRDPAHKKRYGRTWKKIRDSYVKTHPFCELCLLAGKYVPFTTSCRCQKAEPTQGRTSFPFARLVIPASMQSEETDGTTTDPPRGGQNLYGPFSWGPVAGSRVHKPQN